MNVGINYSFEEGGPIGCERTVQIVKQQTDLLQKAIMGQKGIFPCDLQRGLGYCYIGWAFPCGT